MNQFDNARFLHNTEINLLDQQIMNYIDFTYDILKDNYPQLIKTDKAWSEFVDEKIHLLLLNLHILIIHNQRDLMILFYYLV